MTKALIVVAALFAGFQASAKLKLEFDSKKSTLADSNDKQRNEKNRQIKLGLCRDFAEEKFCDSPINEEKCLNDYTFTSKKTFVKGEPKVVKERKYTMKTDGFKFSRKEVSEIEFDSDGDLRSRYKYDRYTMTIKDETYVPTFIVNRNCRGDDDED